MIEIEKRISISIIRRNGAMKRIVENTYGLVVILSLALVVNGAAQDLKSTNCYGNEELIYLPEGWNFFCDEGSWILVFEDEFGGPTLDLSKWRESPDQQGGLFLPGFSQEFRTLNNVEISGGSMKIIAKNESVLKKAFGWKPANEILEDGLPNLRRYDYTSAYVESRFKMPYGKVEASVKIPKGRGFWPGFWLYAGSPWNEIDIFEFWNQYDLSGNFDLLESVKKQEITIHYDKYGNNKLICQSSHAGPDHSLSSHVFSVIFNKNRLSFFVDGSLKRYDVKYFTEQGQETGCQLLGGNGHRYWENLAYPINPMRIIFSLYIQNKTMVNGVERDDSPDATTPFPSQMEVNWVRYYQQHPYINITISDYTQHPIEHELYNVIAGKNVVIDCNYTVPFDECLVILAENSIQLRPGFHAENGSVLRIKADSNLFGVEQHGRGCSSAETGYGEYEQSNGNRAVNSIIVDNEQDVDLPSITPNPSNGIVQIKTESEGDSYSINVTDLHGRQVFMSNYLTEKNTLLNLSSLSKGVYVVRIFNKNSQKQYIRKLIIQ